MSLADFPMKTDLYVGVFHGLSPGFLDDPSSGVPEAEATRTRRPSSLHAPAGHHSGDGWRRLEDLELSMELPPGIIYFNGNYWWDFNGIDGNWIFHQKPSSYWGIPIYGKPPSGSSGYGLKFKMLSNLSA